MGHNSRKLTRLKQNGRLYASGHLESPLPPAASCLRTSTRREEKGIQRLFAQGDRVLAISGLTTPTTDVVDAARESLVVSAL